MIRSLSITLVALTALYAEEKSDLLRFKNGDQLHGQFLGIAEGPSLIWKRKDLNETAKFGTINLRHLVMRGGNPAEPLKSISLIELVNGDQIPGTITDLNEKSLTIESHCAGILTIDRNKVARIAPQPLGGRLHYHGPFSKDRWDIVSYTADNQKEDKAKEPEPGREIDVNLHLRGRMQIHPGIQQANEENNGPGWKHSGAAWYWKNANPGTALILRDKMPKQSTLRFDMAWKSQLNMAIAVHADFCVDEIPQGEPNKEAEQDVEGGDAKAGQKQIARFIPHDSSNLPNIFGNAFILQFHSNYMVIYRSAVDEEGKKTVRRVQTSSNRLRIGENATSTIELRSDLESSNFSLFVNGEFITQWSDPALKNDNMKPVDGSSLAFMPQITNSQVKISDVIIAEWNGMPDSARSLEVGGQDIILMTNGLDRLSGRAVSLEENGILRFKGKHGQFMLPLEDISELSMATEDRLKYEAPSSQQLKIRFSPMGSITGTPLSGDRKNMVLDNPLVGEITISNDSAVMFEFDDSNAIFTNWDANF